MDGSVPVANRPNAKGLTTVQADTTTHGSTLPMVKMGTNLGSKANSKQSQPTKGNIAASSKYLNHPSFRNHPYQQSLSRKIVPALAASSNDSMRIGKMIITNRKPSSSGSSSVSKSTEIKPHHQHKSNGIHSKPSVVPTSLSLNPSGNGNSESDSSKTSSATSPLSPLRLKLINASSSSSSNKQYIISPTPPESSTIVKGNSIHSSSSHTDRKSFTKTSSSAQSKPQHQSVHKPNQNVQSRMPVASAPVSSFSGGTTTAVATSSGIIKPRGETIHQIIDRMKMKGSLRSCSVNVQQVTSSTPPSSLSAEKANNEQPSSPDSMTTGSTSSVKPPTKPQSNLSLTSSSSPSSSTLVDNEADNKVTTTTLVDQDSSSRSPRNTEPVKSPSRIVLRISTKSGETKTIDDSGSTGEDPAKTLSVKCAASPSAPSSAQQSPSTTNADASSKTPPKESSSSNFNDVIDLDDDDDDSSLGFERKLVVDIRESDEEGESDHDEGVSLEKKRIVENTIIPKPNTECDNDDSGRDSSISNSSPNMSSDAGEGKNVPPASVTSSNAPVSHSYSVTQSPPVKKQPSSNVSSFSIVALTSPPSTRPLEVSQRSPPVTSNNKSSLSKSFNSGSNKQARYMIDPMSKLNSYNKAPSSMSPPSSGLSLNPHSLSPSSSTISASDMAQMAYFTLMNSKSGKNFAAAATSKNQSHQQTSMFTKQHNSPASLPSNNSSNHGRSSSSNNNRGHGQTSLSSLASAKSQASRNQDAMVAEAFFPIKPVNNNYNHHLSSLAQSSKSLSQQQNQRNDSGSSSNFMTTYPSLGLGGSSSINIPAQQPKDYQANLAMIMQQFINANSNVASSFAASPSGSTLSAAGHIRYSPNNKSMPSPNSSSTRMAGSQSSGPKKILPNGSSRPNSQASGAHRSPNSSSQINSQTRKIFAANDTVIRSIPAVNVSKSSFLSSSAASLSAMQQRPFPTSAFNRWMIILLFTFMYSSNHVTFVLISNHFWWIKFFPYFCCISLCICFDSKILL